MATPYKSALGREVFGRRKLGGVKSLESFRLVLPSFGVERDVSFLRKYLMDRMVGLLRCFL